MTERTGRHAAGQDAAETLIMPAQRWPADDKIEPGAEPVAPVAPVARVAQARRSRSAGMLPVLAPGQ